MAKSKKHLKRRKKKSIAKKGGSAGYEFPNGYMKTDGESRLCKYDKNHNFIGFATEKETEDWINGR